MEQVIEYPCGLKFVTNLNIFDVTRRALDIDDLQMSGCPLHGHKCNKNIRTQDIQESKR